MNQQLRFAAIAALAAAICFVSVADRLAAAEWPTDWISEEGRTHPLAGQIYDVRASRFIEPSVYLATLAEARFVLLGETHDNPDHHRLQAWVIANLPKRPAAVAFEHFEDGQQSLLDSFQAGLEKSASGDAIERLLTVTAWAASGWPEGKIFRPLFETVIKRRIPMLAANAPKGRVREIARKGAEAISDDARRRFALDRPLGGNLDDDLLGALEESHCGLMPKSAFGSMALAQRFRDAHMAEIMVEAGAGTVVLVGGNGHVRLDRGVPWYLPRKAGHGQSIVTAVAHQEVVENRRDIGGYLADDGGRGAYSYIVFTPRKTRQDPCEEMRKRFGKKSK